MTEDVIILKIGEIFLKGRNRGAFYRQFVRNARRLLADVPGAVVHEAHLRATVEHPPELRGKCVARLHRLFGLQAMAIATGAAKDLEALAAVAVDHARAWPAGTTFKVETKRADKQFPLRSDQVSAEIGARVIQATGLPVDVHRPQRVIRVEIGRERCFVSSETIPGPGGLPVGVSGRVALLLSGGIDSPVAGWSIMRRGCVVDGVYFHSFPYTGDKSKEKVIDLARLLARWQGGMRLHVVHFTEVQKALRDAGPGRLAVLLYRRMMMRAASELAHRARARALVTGENLGQVASQTLQNLGVIEDAASLPVLRPLIAHDKVEIMERARAIGTYETSILPYQDCCALFVPKHPATSAKLVDLHAAEASLDVAALARELADGAQVIEVE